MDEHGHYHCSEPGCKGKRSRTTSKVDLLKHIKRHAPAKCQEPDCYYQLNDTLGTNGLKFRAHVAAPHYSKDKNGSYHCPRVGCDKKKTSKSLLILHIRTHDGKKCPSQSSQVCDLCGTTLKDKGSLQNHMVTQHGGEAKFACKHEGCTYRTNYLHCFNKHVQSVHDKVKDLACDQCPYRTSSQTNLDRHMNSHKDASERTFFGCVICAASFTQKALLKRHVEKSHHTPFTGKAYCSYSSLILYSKKKRASRASALRADGTFRTVPPLGTLWTWPTLWISLKRLPGES